MKRRIGQFIKGLLIVVLLMPSLYLLWLGIRCFVADYFSIPTSSMMPTLQPGDKVVVNKLVMGPRIYTDLNFDLAGMEMKSIRLKGLRKARHNDVAVFNFPYHDGKLNFVINNVYCKRIVAVPGDSLWTESGYYRNNHFKGVLGVDACQKGFSAVPDSVLPKAILNTYPFDDIHIPFTTKNMRAVYVPRCGDVVGITPYEAAYYKPLLEWEIGKKITWDWTKNTVYANGRPIRDHIFKHNYYFMAGDNVIDSHDSRYWGLVPEEYIVGIVKYIYHGRKI